MPGQTLRDTARAILLYNQRPLSGSKTARFEPAAIPRPKTSDTPLRQYVVPVIAWRFRPASAPDARPVMRVRRQIGNEHAPPPLYPEMYTVIAEMKTIASAVSDLPQREFVKPVPSRRWMAMGELPASGCGTLLAESPEDQGRFMLPSNVHLHCPATVAPVWRYAPPHHRLQSRSHVSMRRDVVSDSFPRPEMSSIPYVRKDG